MGLRFIFMLTRDDRTVEDASQQLQTALPSKLRVRVKLTKLPRLCAEPVMRNNRLLLLLSGALTSAVNLVTAKLALVATAWAKVSCVGALRI